MCGCQDVAFSFLQADVLDVCACVRVCTCVGEMGLSFSSKQEQGESLKNPGVINSPRFD